MDDESLNHLNRAVSLVTLQPERSFRNCDLWPQSALEMCLSASILFERFENQLRPAHTAHNLRCIPVLSLSACAYRLTIPYHAACACAYSLPICSTLVCVPLFGPMLCTGSSSFSLWLSVCPLHSHASHSFTPFSAVHKLGPVLDTPELVFLTGPFCAGDFVS